WEWGCRGDGEQGDPAAEIFRLGRLELAVPAHHIGRVVNVVEHWAGENDAVFPDGVGLERKRCDDAEVAAAASQCPEQVWVGCLVGSDEVAVTQDDAGRNNI